MTSTEPFIIDKNLGECLDQNEADFPRENSEGRRVVLPTQDQKYLFDKDGWILIPEVLSQVEITEMRSFCEQLHKDPESISESENQFLYWGINFFTGESISVPENQSLYWEINFCSGESASVLENQFLY